MTSGTVKVTVHYELLKWTLFIPCILTECPFIIPTNAQFKTDSNIKITGYFILCYSIHAAGVNIQVS